MRYSSDPSVTDLLAAAREGDPEAVDRMYALAYEELRRLAHSVRRTRPGSTLTTTAVVHEACIKLIPPGTPEWRDHRHFFGVAARAMRQVLVDAARRRLAAKRGSGALMVTLPEDVDGRAVRPDELLDLHAALQRLETMDPRLARLVELRYFAGLSIEDTAQTLDVSTATVKRDWRVARAWLAQALAS
ncbi:MAG TPA: ECF-type sigma factor [Longimicrobiales bacterium]|nr:ECF-type sigma factor [Longimicrobiales bacterium]